MNEELGRAGVVLPGNWRRLAQASGALKGLRKDKSVEPLLRTLLLHLGCGYSLCETAVRASKANLADLSDVALLKRLRKSKDWLHALCVALFQEQGVNVSQAGGLQVRVFDATTVKEPGRTGALWRIHYSVRRRSMRELDRFYGAATKNRRVILWLVPSKGWYIIHPPSLAWNVRWRTRLRPYTAPPKRVKLCTATC